MKFEPIISFYIFDTSFKQEPAQTNLTSTIPSLTAMQCLIFIRYFIPLGGNFDPFS